MANEREKILLIDDDDIQLQTVEFFLKDEYEIYKALSGDEALQYLNNNEFIPSLIMLDILMPKMDGWEVFSRIRAIDKFKNVPIAFLTSAEGEKERKRARQLGAVDYITKPYNMTELRSRIKDILKNKRK